VSKTTKDQLGNLAAKSIDAGEIPAVILVRPQLGENIGAACRAMLNFGLTDLRLVAPRDGWPNPSADALAAGAIDVLNNAKLFPDTASALADIHYCLAATARRRELELPVVGTDVVGGELRTQINQGRHTAIMFGPEKAGLTNDDVVLADAIITYPINPAFQSLNLAQAVGVFSYIWAASESTAPPPVFDDVQSVPAKREDLVRMFEHLEKELHQSGFFFPEAKTDLMRRNIRAPFTRAKMTEQEVRTMRGIIKALAKGRGHAHKSVQYKDKTS